MPEPKRFDVTIHLANDGWGISGEGFELLASMREHIVELHEIGFRGVVTIKGGIQWQPKRRTDGQR